MYKIYVYDLDDIENADGDDALKWLTQDEGIPKIGHILLIPGMPTIERVHVIGDIVVCHVRFRTPWWKVVTKTIWQLLSRNRRRV